MTGAPKGTFVEKQGNVTVAQFDKDSPTNIEIGKNGISVGKDGSIMQYTRNGKGDIVRGPEHFDCELAEKIRAAVADSMKDGKLSPQEAKNLTNLVSNAPNSKGSKQCLSAGDL